MSEEVKDGRLYVEFNCQKCGKVYMVHLLYADYARATEGVPCRPPCPDCATPGALPKRPRMFGAFDGGKGTPSTVKPYTQPAETITPSTPPKRYG